MSGRASRAPGSRPARTGAVTQWGRSMGRKRCCLPAYWRCWPPCPAPRWPGPTRCARSRVRERAPAGDAAGRNRRARARARGRRRLPPPCTARPMRARGPRRGVRRYADPASRTAIIAGTTRSAHRLYRGRARIDTTGVAGAWEAYSLQVVERPEPGIDRALVVVGADRRGTAFGLYELCAASASPLDLVGGCAAAAASSCVRRAGTLHRRAEGEYRGIFINDEEPALGGWTRTFGGTNHRFYERVPADPAPQGQLPVAGDVAAARVMRTIRATENSPTSTAWSSPPATTSR